MIMVMTKNKLKSIQKSLKKGMPNLSRQKQKQITKTEFG